MQRKIIDYIKKEVVLCVAIVLALVSMIIIPLDAGYGEYIDVKVLALLFSLMIVMAGLKKQGIFKALAATVISRASHTMQLRLLLMLLCFFSAMLITNDVALITFVPFTIIIYTMAGLREQMMYVVVLQTVAANLGSMLTPVGNPQNLYLYTISGMSLGAFLKTMLPLTLVSALILIIGCVVGKKQPVEAVLQEDKPEMNSGDKLRIGFYVLLFLLSILSVVRVLPYYVPLLVAVVGTLFLDQKIFREVDYSLLLTFVGFFVFVGNMGRVEVVRSFLSDILQGRELLVSFLGSQVISNVPAAVLLSGFTDNWAALLKGVNIGGLGTLIASMASLISYKLLVKEEPGKKGKYFLMFTGVNVLFAILLLLLGICAGI